MGRRRRERKLLEAAALCSVEKVKQLLEKGEKKKKRDSRRRDSSSDSDTHKRRKRRHRQGDTDEAARGRKRRNRDSGDSRSNDSDSSRDPSPRRKTKSSRKVAVNCIDFDGWTPLHHAAYGGSEDVINLLLSAGADVDARDMKGNTPLHMAARNGHTRAISALRRHGGMMDVKNDAGQSPSSLVQERLRDFRAKSVAARFEERLQDEIEGWGVWGDETDDAAGRGSMSRSGKGWDWSGEERAHRSGLNVPSHEYEEDLDPDDSWRDEIADEMARRRMKREKDSEDAFLANARKEWEEMKRKKAEKEQESHRILEEERRKDKAWRDSVLKGGVVDVRKKYDAAWETFTKSALVGITLKDIPFPVSDGEENTLKDVILVGLQVSEHRKRIREEVLRWHPDKFMQKWGKRLLERDREAVSLRVKSISQAVQDVYFSLGKSDAPPKRD